jgi:hypothetical protein
MFLMMENILGFMGSVDLGNMVAQNNNHMYEKLENSYMQTI